MRLHFVAEVGRILHDAGDQQAPPALLRHLDGQVDAFVRMDAANENEVFPPARSLGIERQIDSVVDRRQIIQSRRAIRIADGNEIPGTILLVDRHDLG